MTNTRKLKPIENPFREISKTEKFKLMRRLEAARVTLLAMVPFFGHLCLSLRPREARPQDQVPTAAVAPDGTLILNYDFCDQLTDEEFCGLLCHEVLHPALFCWMRQGSRGAIVQGPQGQKFSLWNLAHDLSFNPEIVELARNSDASQHIQLPPEGAYDEKYKGVSAEEIYDELLSQAVKNKQNGQGCDSGAMGVFTKFPGGGHGIGDDLRPDLAETAEGQKAADGDKISQEALQDEWKVNIMAAATVQEQEKSKGSLPGGLQKIVDAIKNPRVDWKDVLSRWMGENGRRQDYTYRRPARRSESIGEYMPSLLRFGVDKVWILWDTSGSMNGREGEILGDVQGICEDLGLTMRVIMCDAAIQGIVENVQDAEDLVDQIVGGGGSDFCPAFDMLVDEQYDGVVIAFTDGYINVPPIKPHLIKEVLWVIGPNDVDPTVNYGGGTAWGEVLHTNEEEESIFGSTPGW